MKKFFGLLCLAFAFVSAKAGVQLQNAEGWLESAFVEWIPSASAAGYHVYVSEASSGQWTLLDAELVRKYEGYGRADALGLKAGEYKLRVVPVATDGSEMDADATETEPLEVKAHDRTGFAHFGRGEEGVGAYKNDGTLKDNAIVLYVNANNAKTLTVTWLYDTSSGKTKTYTGIQTIIDGYRKCLYAGSPLPALCIRVVGMIKDEDVDKFLSSGEGIAIKGEKEYSELPLTLEGVGNDATLWGFGIQVSNAVGVEIRNLAIMLCMDDALSVSSNNSNCWFHHNDIFYGQVGSDADQVKGDGSIDIKLSQYCTVSYNHFFDCGKCCLIDAKSVASGYANQLTYHHNWFDHADQRLPRCRNGNAFHVFNNYYDGNSLYGVGMACGSSALVEGNYFRNCKYPVIASAQGTDKNLVNSKASKKGLLSGENGGIVKWWNNYVEGATSFITQNDNSATSFDAYAVTARDEQIPANIVTLKGGTSYSNFDTDSENMYLSTPDDPAEVPALVTGQYGAGRCEQGDFRWVFDNAKEDANQELIPELKSAISDYLSTLVGYYSGETIRNGGGTVSISGVRATTPTGTRRYFDLLGRPVAKPQPHGLYIVR
ncbi:MAG: right-handed parallel beta-helix repeat-containing protein [Bacteroidales bacterium]|nr:right-handed parallel beta-helix repeat-containing protein [Bacteroidales bacterium]